MIEINTKMNNRGAYVDARKSPLNSLCGHILNPYGAYD